MGRSNRGRLVIQSVDQLDKEELKLIQEDMANLGVDDLELDEDDDRDALILKLQEVNEKLMDKLVKLEQVVEQTVEKAYNATKRNISTHRNWEDDGDDSIKQKNKQIKQIQQTINGHKKTISSLKVQLSTLSGADRMVALRNELKDTERQRKQLETDVALVEKNIRHQQEMAGDTDQEFTQKLKDLKDQLEQTKQ